MFYLAWLGLKICRCIPISLEQNYKKHWFRPVMENWILLA